MILRSLTKHVKDQNWFAVFLDFFIVVVGVFIGIQVSNWNEEWQARQSEEQYLIELQRDIDADLEQAKNGQISLLAKIALSEAILKLAAPEYERASYVDLGLPEELAINEALAPYPFLGLTSTPTMNTEGPTYEELKQTGNFSYISDAELVDAITKYYKFLENQRAIFDNLLDQTDPFLEYLRRNGRFLGDRATLEDVVSLTKTDKEFLGFIKAANYLGLAHYNRLKLIENDAEALLIILRTNGGQAS